MFARFGDRLKKLSGDVRAVNLEYPGHGARFAEALSGSIEELAGDAYRQMCKNRQFLAGDYSMVGYSMGSIICHEVLQIIRRNRDRLPRSVFFMACDAPGTEPAFKGCLSFSADDVKRILQEEGGTPGEVLACPEFIEMLKDTVRYDYSALEMYRPAPSQGGGRDFGETDFYVIRGDQETCDETALRGWDSFYGKEMVYLTMPGKHFFLFEDDGNLAALCGMLVGSVD